MRPTDSLLRPIRESYVRKFTVIIVAVTLLVLAFGFFTQSTVSSKLTIQRNDEILTTTQQQAAGTEAWFERQADTVRLLSESLANDEKPDSIVRSSLSRQRRALPNSTVAIHLVDRTTEQIRLSTRESAENTDLSDQHIEWKRGSLTLNGNNDVAVSEVYVRYGSKRIAFISPLPQSLQAVVIVHQLKTIRGTFRNSIEGENTVIVDSNGEIQLASANSTYTNRTEYDKSAKALAQGVNGTTGVYDHGGDVIAYAPVEGTDWVMIKQASTANVYALREGIRRNILLLLVLAMGGIGVLGIVVGRDIRRSLPELADRASSLAKGDLSTDVVETDRIDEFGEVQSAFADIQQYIETVALQAGALADQEFDSPALDNEVPGGLGDALQTLQTDLQNYIEELEDAKVAAEQSQQEAQALASELEAQAEEFSMVMQRAADGDLTERLSAGNSNNSMDEIAAAFNEMLTELEKNDQ